MKTAYPAIIHPDADGIWVEFPDLEGCFSDGDTIVDAVSNAQNALGAYLCSMIERGLSPAPPSDIRSVAANDGIVTVIVTDPTAFRRDTHAVKKTLSIPAWLNDEAIRHNINFSSVLQEALRVQLQV